MGKRGLKESHSAALLARTFRRHSERAWKACDWSACRDPNVVLHALHTYSSPWRLPKMCP